MWRRAVAGLVAAGFSIGAQAELSNDSMLGPGLRSRPAYDGSDSRRTELVPVVRHFGDHWFIRSTQGVFEGGPRAEIAPGLHAALQLAYEPGRLQRESAFLAQHGVADLRAGASLGVQVEWDHLFDPVPVTLLARVRQNLTSERGAQADLRFSVGVFHSGPVSAGVFVQGVWANAKSTHAFYGITPTQSAGVGLPAFDAGAGLLATSVGLLGSIDLGPHWLLVGSAEARQLRGDARRSPLVQRRNASVESAGLAYRF